MKHFQPVGEVVETEVPVLDDDARLVLREDFRMRREDHFVSFWRLGDDSLAHDLIHLHPSTAIMIALFDGQRTVAQVSKDYAYAAGVPKQEAREAVERLVAASPERFVSADKIAAIRIRKYAPRSFIIPAKDIDLTAKRLGAPAQITFNVTNDCVADCVYCYAERQRHGQGGLPLPLSKVIELADEIAELGIPGTSVSGGDPFMHPHIVEILAAFLSRGIHAVVSTKRELSNEIISRLRDIGLDRLQVSIDTTDEATHRMLTRVPGLLQKSLATAKRARAAGMRVLVNAVLTRHNVKQMRQLVEELMRIGVTSISFTEYTRSLYHHFDGLLLTADQINEAQETVQDLRSKHSQISIEFRRTNVQQPFEQRAVCTGAVHQATIYPDGKVVPCDMCPSKGPTVLGDLTQRSLKEVWDSERVDSLLHPDRFLFRGTVCEACEEFDECHNGRGRCFAKSLLAYGRVFAPTPECPKAPRSEAWPKNEDRAGEQAEANAR